MNFLAVVGAFVITISLLSYGIGCIAAVRFKIVTPGILVFLTLGVVLDFVAVTLMVINSEKSMFSMHGILGYSAMLTMLVNTFLVWRCYFKGGFDSVISHPVIIYTKIAYAWWLIAYITGSILVIWPIG